MDFFVIAQAEIADNAVEVSRFPVVAVVSPVFLNEQEDVQAAHGAESQAEKVDEAEGLVPPEIAEGDFEEVCQHGRVGWFGKSRKWLIRRNYSA